MCRGLIRVSHNNKDSMGETIIRTKIKAKGGVTIRIRIVKKIKGMCKTREIPISGKRVKS